MNTALLILSLLASPYYGGPFYDGSGISSSTTTVTDYTAATMTTGTITLAVSSTGSDTATTSRPVYLYAGNYSAYPFLTIQAAINALPVQLRHQVIISVGAGTFAGFAIPAFIGSQIGTNTATITIYGNIANVTPTSGSATGTATSGTTTTLTKTSAGWTVDDFKGKFLTITAGTNNGNTYVIAKNTADTITIAAPASSAFDATSVYALQFPNTVISGNATGRTGGAVITGMDGSIILMDLAFTGGTYGVNINGAAAGWVSLREISVDGGSRGVLLANSGAGIHFNMLQVSFLNSTTYGFELNNLPTDSLPVSTGVVVASASKGVRLLNSPMTIGGLYVRNSTTNGVIIAGGQNYALSDLHIDTATVGMTVTDAAVSLTTADVSNCSSSTIVPTRAQLYFAGSLTGTGNTGWGLNLYNSASVVQSAITPTISGSSGAVTVNGSTDRTWAIYIAESPSSAIATSGLYGTSVVASGLSTAGIFYNSSMPTTTPTGTSITVDWSTSNVQTVTLASTSGNVTSVTFNGLVAAGVYTLKLIQHASSPRTVAGWPSVKWAGGTAPTITATNSAVDVLGFLYDGSTIYGFTSGQDLK